jgi:hypothetical protein
MITNGGRYSVSKSGATKVELIVGAAKVMTIAGPVWCHFSQRGETVKLRTYSEGKIHESAVDNDDIVDFVPGEKCKTLAGLTKLPSYKKIEKWTAILQALAANVPPPVEDSVKPTTKAAKSPRITVPITYLRQFYETMKLLETATWVNLAAFYSKEPKWLERLWRHSRNAFETYKNGDDWGRGTTEDLPTAPKSVSAIKTTDEFTAFITKHGNRLGEITTSYTFVERELNPRRTRLGEFSDKRPATKSGTGGIDVLFRSHATGFPVVGEIKVRRDKNAFFGLIQAMTYAVELSTPNQLARLKKHFAAFGKLDVDAAEVDIVLVMVNHVKDRSLEPVLELVKALNNRKKCKGLGRITLMENTNHGEEWTSH